MTGRSPNRSARMPLGYYEAKYAIHIPVNATPIDEFETPNVAVIWPTTGLIASRPAIVAKNASVHSASNVSWYRQRLIRLSLSPRSFRHAIGSSAGQ
jgi:hypothetical protein